MTMTADAAFDRDVPEHLREDVYQRMAEAVSGMASHASVTIHETDRIDAVNVRASGVVEVDGIEYGFRMEDGNNNGTVLLAWNDDRPLEVREPTLWALQPTRENVSRAVQIGRERLLLMKWQALMTRPDVADIVRRYAYDRHFSPGVVTDRHWRDAAARLGMEIVTEETAAETRRHLQGAA